MDYDLDVSETHDCDTCAVCGTPVEDGETICEDCIDNMVECEFCGKMVSVEQAAPGDHECSYITGEDTDI